MNTMTVANDISHHAVPATSWIGVCNAADLLPDTGLCALVKQWQIAIFYSHRLQEYFAVSNYDPIGKANVLSRGIMGSVGDVVVVASPLYKQHFNLRTGVCLEKPEYSLKVFPIRVFQGEIQLFV